jgi:YVTN family beta-propeller protein
LTQQLRLPPPLTLTGFFVDGQPVASPDGSRVYVGGFNSSFTAAVLSAIDTSTNTIVAATTFTGDGNSTLPFFLAITPDGKTLYGCSFDGSHVIVIDTASLTVTTTIPVAGAANGVAITPNGARAYVSLQSANAVVAIDTATNAIVGSPIPVGAGPGLMASTPNGAFIYVANSFDNTLSVIATATNTVVGSAIPVGASPDGVAISPDGSSVYVANSGDNTVSVIATATNTVVGPAIAVGNVPQDLKVTPDGASVYVANQNSTVSVIDTSNSTVTAIPVPGDLVFIAITNPSAPFSNFVVKGLTVNNNGFTEAGVFTLGPNSTGIDLAHQPVTLTVGSFSLTIPAGSFKQVGGNMHFVFNGTINGMPVSVTLMATGGTSTSFMYSVTVTGVNLTGQPNPATVGLTIGENSGTTTAPF